MNFDHRRSTFSASLDSRLRWLSAPYWWLGGTTAAYAEVNRAVLEGTVSDPSGSVIVGAAVKVVAVES